jgi:uncharacterized iron-regulated protein
VATSEQWLTRLDVAHPLVGKIWDVKAQAFVDEATLGERAAKARFVLVGERHDNPDHHRLQARVLQKVLDAGRRPALVLEMLEPAQQAAADSFLVSVVASAAGFGAAVGWAKTSWPPFSDYQPIFEAAFAAKLRIVAGNLAQSDVKALVKHGVSALPTERVHQLRLDEALPEALQTPLLEELRASHCGQLPESLLAPMALAQRARDAEMARQLIAAGAADGAVLIAGGGHARLDRAVPRYLALDAPGSSVVSISIREVRHDANDANAYAAEEGPFDYLWFTPRGSDEDPCVAFKAPSK